MARSFLDEDSASVINLCEITCKQLRHFGDTNPVLARAIKEHQHDLNLIIDTLTDIMIDIHELREMTQGLTPHHRIPPRRTGGH